MGRTLFTDVNILDCTGAQPYAGEVLVEGNRIKQIAKAGKKLPRDGAHTVDGGGATLMPGLIESHGHISFCDTSTLEGLGDIPPEEHTLKTMKYAKVMLDQGFTAIFSAAAAKARLDVVIRNAIDAGEIPGPRMRAASPELTVTGGLGDVRRAHMYRETFAITCDGPDEFRKVAREMCREGVDTLKINPSGDEFIPFARAHQTVMNDAEVAAVAEVAKSRGKTLAAHCRSAESVKMALRHGVDVLYHCTLSDAEALDMLEAHKNRIFIAPAMGIMYTTAVGEGSGYGIDYDAPGRHLLQARARPVHREHEEAEEARPAHPARRRLRLRLESDRHQRARHRAFREAARLQADGRHHGGDQAGRRDHGHGQRARPDQGRPSRRRPAGRRQSALRRQHAARQGPPARRS